MRRMILPLMLLAAACQPVAVELSDDDVAAINDWLEANKQAATVGDWDAWSQLWTQDVVSMIPNDHIITGRAALREATIEAPALPDLSVTVDEIEGRADLAYVRSTSTFSLPSENAGEPVTERQKSLIILRRMPDGTWQGAIECFNADLPLPSTEGQHSEGQEQT